MTHEELLAYIESFIAEFCDEIRCLNCSPWKALRTVVKLHQPIWTFPEGSNNSMPICLQCRDSDFPANYPCSTIQDIEKELR